MVRVLPGEAAIEYQHLIGSALPFPNQPGSGLQLGARTYPPLWAVIELLSKSTKLALPLRAEAAESDFLHPVCDSSHQQLAAEVRGRLSFVETTPLMTQFADVEGGEARERLLADGVSPVGGLTDRGRRRARFLASRGVADGEAHGFAGMLMR